MSQSSHPVDQAVSFFLSTYSGKSILVALSGGKDSIVLLHALSKQLPHSPLLKAMHVHHGLQSQADAWLLFCQKTCLTLNVSFTFEKVVIDHVSRQGVEAVARKKRYKSLHFNLSHQDVMVTGHHQRDQAETFFLSLMRASGIAGLSAMPIEKSITLDDGFARHVRPLLAVSYDDITDYALLHDLKWVEDATNHLCDHKRNVVRNRVLPRLAEDWPNPVLSMARSSALMSESLSLLNDLVVLDLGSVPMNNHHFNLSEVSTLRWERQKNMIRYWFVMFLPVQVNASIYAWLNKEASNTNTQSVPLYTLSTGFLRLYKGNLYWNGLTDLDDGFISALGFGYSASWKNSQEQAGVVQMTITRCFEEGVCQKSSSLKTWFKQQNIPPWVRADWPVLVKNGKCIAILGFKELKH